MADINVKLSSETKSILLDKRKIEKISSLSQIGSNLNSLSYDAISNSGIVEIIDTNGSILKEIEGFGKNKTNVVLFSNAKDFSKNAGVVQKHILNDSKYYSEDKKVSLSLLDRIVFLDANIDEIYLYNEHGEKDLSSSSLYSLTRELFVKAGFSQEEINYAFKNLVIRNENTLYNMKEYFSAITIKYPFLDSGTVRNNINKICAVAQVCFIQDQTGSFVFIDARPVKSVNDKPIVINSSNIFKPLTFDPLSKMQIKSVGYNKKSQILTKTEIKSVDFSFYDQANKSRLSSISYSGGTISRMLYSNNWSDYNKRNTTNDSTTKFIDYTANDKQVILKTDVEINKATDMKFFYIEYNNTNTNYYNESYNLDSTSSNNPVLFNTLFNGQTTRASRYIPVFVDSEQEAISYIESNPTTAEACLIKNGKNKYSIYALINKGLEFAVNPSSYKGEIRIIYLNGTITISTDCISDLNHGFVNQNSDYEINDNQLMRLGTTLNNIDIYSIQESNIVEDFSNGVLTGTITVGCSDYFDFDGNKVKNWNNGEIINVGDKISIFGDTTKNGEPRCWVVVGCDFIYDSESLLKLDVLEVRSVETKEPFISSGLYSSDGTQISNWNELISTSAITVSNNVVTGSDSSKLIGYLRVPEEITGIGESAFDGCSGLTSFIPDTSTCNITEIGNYAFRNCSSMTNITIPDSVVTVGEYAFYGCSSASALTIGANVNTIKEREFNSCSKLKGTVLNIPKNLKQIQNCAFSGIGFSNIVVDSGNTAFKVENGCLMNGIGEILYLGSDKSGNLNIPSSVLFIEEEAFVGCNKITSVLMPDKNLSVGKSAFKSCFSLEQVWFSDSHNSSIGSYAFEGCSSLRNVEISMVEFIENYAFRNCTALSNVFFADVDTAILYSIGTEAFYNCPLLTEFHFPSSVSYIGSRAFHLCSGLVTAVFYKKNYWYVWLSSGYKLLDVTNSSANPDNLRLYAVAWERYDEIIS